jgi:hypothetical protein
MGILSPLGLRVPDCGGGEKDLLEGQLPLGFICLARSGSSNATKTQVWIWDKREGEVHCV